MSVLIADHHVVLVIDSRIWRFREALGCPVVILIVRVILILMTLLTLQKESIKA
jgi:hypothetical protein